MKFSDCPAFSLFKTVPGSRAYSHNVVLSVLCPFYMGVPMELRRLELAHVIAAQNATIRGGGGRRGGLGKIEEKLREGGGGGRREMQCTLSSPLPFLFPNFPSPLSRCACYAGYLKRSGHIWSRFEETQTYTKYFSSRF